MVLDIVRLICAGVGPAEWDNRDLFFRKLNVQLRVCDGIIFNC